MQNETNLDILKYLELQYQEAMQHSMVTGEPFIGHRLKAKIDLLKKKIRGEELVQTLRKAFNEQNSEQFDLLCNQIQIFLNND